MKLNAETARQRSLEVPSIIHELALDNAVLYRAMQEFIHGNIITKEEMLCRMVVELSMDWTSEQQRAYESYALLLNCPKHET